MDGTVILVCHCALSSLQQGIALYIRTIYYYQCNNIIKLLWYLLLYPDGIPALVALLTLSREDIQSVAASVLCNISENEAVREALTQAKAGPILIELLKSPVDEIQSRASIILADLACVGDNQTALAEEGVITALIHLLDSELEDVLVNAVNAIRVLCTDNPANQTAVAEHGGIDPLVEFLGDTVNSGRWFIIVCIYSKFLEIIFYGIEIMSNVSGQISGLKFV